MALAIRSDMTATVLRGWARRTRHPRAASRAFAIAHALDGLSRAEAARLAGVERQALRDAVGATTPRVWQACSTDAGSDAAS